MNQTHFGTKDNENGVKNDILNLIYETSKTAKIKIKTPVGNSNEANVEEIVMQGESVSIIMCISAMDRISQDYKETGYKYRNEVDIQKLGYVDDLIDIQNVEKTQNYE